MQWIFVFTVYSLGRQLTAKSLNGRIKLELEVRTDEFVGCDRALKSERAACLNN